MNNKNTLYLSICIPAYGRLEYVVNTLKSIYNEDNLSKVALTEFEVILADNDPLSSLKVLCDDFKFPNFYYHNTTCEGFMNSYYSLSLGKGEFLKLHNSQELWNSGTLPFLIKSVKDNIDEKPLFFFTSALLKSGNVYEYYSFDDFLYQLSYFSTWSNGFSIWREDFITLNSIPLNNIFPQTSILFTQYTKNKYIINDIHLFNTQFVPNRKGYNKIQAFSVQFPSLVEELYVKGVISLKTKNKVMADLFWNYLPNIYFNVNIAKREFFDSSNIKKNIEINYSTKHYYLMLVLSLFVPFKIIWRKFKIKYLLKPNFNQ